MIPTWLYLIGIGVLFILAVIVKDHDYHNAVRRGFGLKEETLWERFHRNARD